MDKLISFGDSSKVEVTRFAVRGSKQIHWIAVDSEEEAASKKAELLAIQEKELAKLGEWEEGDKGYILLNCQILPCSVLGKGFSLYRNLQDGEAFLRLAIEGREEEWRYPGNGGLERLERDVKDFFEPMEVHQ